MDSLGGPILVSIKHLDDGGNIVVWNHTPDVLIFRQGYKPSLYQIKDMPDASQSPKNIIINKACLEYANKLGWNYFVIDPKLLDENLKYNIKFLHGFIKKRNYYNELIPRLIDRLTVLESTSIIELSNSFTPLVRPALVSSVIYHLIAKGNISINLYKKLSQNSEIFINDDRRFIFNYLTTERFE